MLTGRESLLRVVGKRRRYLPNRRSFLSASSSSSSFQSCLSPCEKDEIVKRNSVEETESGVGDLVESVNCPVCGTQLRGLDNTLINSHLDECLAKGSKRKLSQLSLLQFNFSRSKVKVHSNWQNDKGDQVITSDLYRISSCDLIHNVNELATSEEDDNNLRYGSRKELDTESRVCLSRDPENVKDPNAIKVLYADCEYDNMLGYIPRELAQYLSPLIDKFYLNFEGSIISVPKDAHAAVPIQIICKNGQICNQISDANIQDFKSLWRQALNVAELAKTNPFGMTRYQRNLVLLIQDVLENNQHLFTTSEMSFLEAFKLLPDDSQRLFARLYTRKGFMLSTHFLPVKEVTGMIEHPNPDVGKGPGFGCLISYPEIADCQLAIKGLLGLQTSSVEFSILLHPASSSHKCDRSTRKQEMIDLLLSSSKNMVSPELRSSVLAITGSCIRVSPLAESLMWRAERLFFLNGEQDLSAFLLVDLGIVKFPDYKCIISDPIFPNRRDLLSYEEAIEISQIMVESLDENNSELVLRCIEVSSSRMSIALQDGKCSSGGPMVAFFSYFSASWVYSKVVLLGVSFFEREKRYIDAISLLRQLLDAFIFDGRRGYWTLRLSVDLEHVGRLDESLQVAEDGLLDPWVRAGSRVALQRRVLRLGKPPRRWKVPSYSESVKRKIFEVHVQGRPLNCKTGMKSIFYNEDGEQCGVEQLALHYYAGEGGGWQGVHTESGIWLTIFGVLMWDIIFADVPNVFRTKFQTAPLDLETDSFYEVRKGLIEELLHKIQDGMAEEILITSWESHVGTACRGVNWEKHSLADLRAAVKCIGGHCIASICRHLAQDYRSWSSGMPDLLLWRLHDCYRGEAKLVEVKGPRDRLSEQQRAWLLVLMDCGFNVEVCKVTPPPAPS
ncbi:Fanconi-associated nuclease 1 [Sesamum angolense]|uniref:Fanconi-associated nuclease n=1 Tax=Sesamum angolense TaxID=2727404 RepID=A0AAE2BJS8_9LAMI|nr:Fanconi-associated nuclease 1 [Sesamum angolense]